MAAGRIVPHSRGTIHPVVACEAQVPQSSAKRRTKKLEYRARQGRYLEGQPHGDARRRPDRVGASIRWRCPIHARPTTRQTAGVSSTITLTLIANVGKGG